MKELKHTPGEWVVAERKCCVLQGDETGPRIACCIGPSWTQATIEANARLIASAPELLEALHETLALALLKWGNLDPDATQIFDKAKAVIAKATT